MAMAMRMLVIIVVVVVAAEEVDASWASHNHEHRWRGRGGARYYYYNTLLQRAQRHKPEELQNVYWDTEGKMFHMDPETQMQSSRLPDDLAWVTLSVSNLKNNLRNSLDRPLSDGENEIIEALVDNHLQTDGVVWYNLNTGDTSYTVPLHSAWERRLVTDDTVFD